MTFHALGGAEAGDAGNARSGVYSGSTNDSIVVAPGGFPGAFSYCIDPLNAPGDIYGFRALLPDTPTFLIVPFMFRFEADYDAALSIAELGGAVAFDGFARRLVLTVDEGLQLVDEDEASIDLTANGYVANSTAYPMLWYIDLRVEANSRDILWVWKAGAWDKALDISGWGTGDPTKITGINFGSRIGKTAPTAGGDFYVDEMAVQVLNISPNTDPVGSVTTVVKIPKANGADGDFDTGSGVGAHPDWNLVKEIPPDDVTSYDEGDVSGDQQSYEPEDADGGDTPLAIQVIGQAARDGGATSNTIRSYLLEGGTRDYAETWAVGTLYRSLRGGTGPQPKTWNTINGQAITEALFNAMEIGLEAVDLTAGGGGTIRLSQILAEYIIPGPEALPGDFPALVTMGGDRRRLAGFV